MTGNKNWDAVSRINHWLVAFAMIAMVGFGIYLEEFAPSGPEKGVLIGLHKAFGVVVLIYGLWRVGYRVVRGFLEDAAPMPKWQSVAAKAVHWVLLISILAMPISGLMGSYFGGRDVDVFGIFTIYGAMDQNKELSDAFMGMHGLFGKVTIGAFLLHLVGAIKHHVVDKDDTLKRMVGRA